MWSVSVGMERLCAVVGDLVQLESAQKGFVRTQYKEVSKNPRYQTGARTVNDGCVSRNRSARDHDFMSGL